MRAPKPSSSSAAAVASAADTALRDALEQVLAPVAELCLARGLRFAVLEETLKRAFVDRARGAQPQRARATSAASARPPD